MTTAARAPAAPATAGALPSVRRVLLACGILSSLLYVAATIGGALRWQGYSSISQAVSELAAIGAPSRPLVAPLFLAYDVLIVAFGVGVWRSASGARALRITAGLLVGLGLVGLLSAPFPMHLRGVEPTLTDTMHIVLTSVTVLLILFAIGFGSTALGDGFRVYSIATILILVIFGALAAFDGPRIAAQLPTPWMGVTERINIGGCLLWVVVLATALLRRPRARSG